MSATVFRPHRRNLLKLTLGLAMTPFALNAAALADEAKPDVIRIGSTAPGHLKFILFRNRKILGPIDIQDSVLA